MLGSTRSRCVTFTMALTALLLGLGLGTGGATAQPPLLTGLGGAQGFGTDCLHRNDDSSSAPIDLTPAFPGGLDFFGTRYTSIYVNTNGNVSFNSGVSDWTAEPFPVTPFFGPPIPMIAPYWGDVDIRTGDDGMCTSESAGTACADPTENGVWWHLEPGLMVVTWHEVGYFSCHDDKKMNFQLILTEGEDACGGAGDFDVEFRFNKCDWHSGDASGGVDGFCDPADTCTPAQAGFDAGNGTDFVEIAGSRMDNINTIMCDDSNVADPGIWRFQIRSGSVVCPEAGDVCDTGMTGVCGDGVTQCVGAGVSCLPVVPASPERCDSLDNDCDGMADEGDDICGPGSVCERGVCTALCFEGGCPEGQECGTDGVCQNIGCEDVICDEGERCRGGACVDACDGVDCPYPLSCIGGSCQDVCGSLTCDDCTVCEDGGCVPRCPDTPCESGQECTSDGRCVDAGCSSITCGAGEECVGGACQDACINAVCPTGQQCLAGVCSTPMRPEEDAGTGSDGGGVADTGPSGLEDGAVPCPIGFDCSDPVPSDDGGCGCSIPGAAPERSPSGLPAIPAIAAFVSFLALRRRRRDRR